MGRNPLQNDKFFWRYKFESNKLILLKRWFLSMKVLKTLWKYVKMLITSISSFPYKIFESSLLQDRYHTGLFGKVLMHLQTVLTHVSLRNPRRLTWVDTFYLFVKFSACQSINLPQGTHWFVRLN